MVSKVGRLITDHILSRSYHKKNLTTVISEIIKRVSVVRFFIGEKLKNKLEIIKVSDSTFITLPDLDSIARIVAHWIYANMNSNSNESNINKTLDAERPSR